MWAGGVGSKCPQQLSNLSWGQRKRIPQDPAENQKAQDLCRMLFSLDPKQ